MDTGQHQSQAAQIEALIQEVAAFPEPQMRMKVEKLLHALLDMYGEGIERIFEMMARAETTGQALIEMMASDELVGALLLLHGLHPLSLETRLHQALEDIQSTVQSHGGTLEFIQLKDGIATLRLTETGCHGCQSSQAMLRQMVEEAVYNAAPDLDEVQIEEDVASRQVGIPVKFISPRKRKERTSSNSSISVPSGQEPGQIGTR